MARRGTKGKVGEPFVSIPESWFRYLHDSHASAVEICVFLALAQHPQRNGYFCRPVADFGSDYDGTDRVGICTATNIRKDQVTRALSNLCTKRTITLPDGTTTTVLTPVVKGRRGRVAVYRCNLPRPSAKKARDTGKGNRATNANEKDGSSAAQNDHGKDGSTANTVKAAQPPLLEKKVRVGTKTHPPLPWLR